MTINRIYKNRILRAFSLVFFVFVILHIYMIWDLEIMPASKVEFKKKSDTYIRQYIEETDISVSADSVINYIDSLEYILQKHPTLYYYELPYTFNLGISDKRYPGMKHARRFICVWKEDGEANFIRNDEEHIQISEDKEETFLNRLNLIDFGLDGRNFSYSCDFFEFTVKLKFLSYWEKTKWLFASEYGIGQGPANVELSDPSQKGVK